LKRTIDIGDLTFETYIDKEELANIVEAIAGKLQDRIDENDVVVFMIILKGSMIFGADLMRAYGRSSYLEFIRVKSYEGTSSNRMPVLKYESYSSIEGKHIILVEDIVETGYTFRLVQDMLKEKGAEKVTTVTLLRKPQMAECEVQVDLVGKNIGDAFVVGYGLDYNGLGRQLKDIYRLKESVNPS
jgi:hypoxanthine phosphoribosyltransferase